MDHFINNKFDIIVICLFICIMVLIIILRSYTSKSKNDLDKQVDEILNKKEKFIVSDADDIHNYREIRAEQMNEKDSFPDQEINYKPVPTYDYTLQYVEDGLPIHIANKEDPKTIITKNEYSWIAPQPAVSCSNSSINNRFLTGKKRIMPYEIACGYPNKITSENYYKGNFMAWPAKLEDDEVKGANYLEYEKWPRPQKSNVRILSQNTKGLPPSEMIYKNIPVGANYAFNTPVLPMP